MGDVTLAVMDIMYLLDVLRSSMSLKPHNIDGMTIFMTLPPAA